MAAIICPKCKHKFDNNRRESLVTRGAAAAAGATAGAIYGAGVGIVIGPGGGISGAVPGGMIGGVTGWFAADQFRHCPKCKKDFQDVAVTEINNPPTQ
jgi:phage tail tape-measure protein